MRVGLLTGSTLKTRDLSPVAVRDDDGNEIGISSVASQFESLYYDGYRMVEELDFEELEKNSPDIVVTPEPYMDGEIIRYKYKHSTPTANKRMAGIKDSLGNSDFAVIKAMESFLLENSTSEETIELIQERKALRSEFNNLEKTISDGETENLSR